MNIVLATYNLWNLMFYWEVRKNYVSEMIIESNADIIAFQEVCAERDLNRNQVHEIQDILPEYRFAMYHVANVVKKSEKCWHEGVGLLSRHPIIHGSRLNFTRPFAGTDSTQRVAFYAQFDIKGHEVSVVTAHFSYDRYQQCLNSADLMTYLYAYGVENTIVLGDFNVYKDFQWPIEALMNGRFPEKAPQGCRRHGALFDQDQYRGQGYLFKDAWTVLKRNDRGFTFSNMPEPGFINRPDRVLVSNAGIKAVSTVTTGRGKMYAIKYGNALWWKRLTTVLRSTRGCLHDCGPHGSCRCGVCVSGGNENSCENKSCLECSTLRIAAMFISMTTSIAFLCCSVTALTLHRNKCLLFFKASLGRFRSKSAFFVYLMLSLLFFICFRLLIGDVLRLVERQLPEELHPSDHLMLVAKVDIS